MLQGSNCARPQGIDMKDDLGKMGDNSGKSWYMLCYGHHYR